MSTVPSTWGTYVRLDTLLSEAWRNVRTGASRPFVLCALLAPVVLGLSWLDMTQAQSILDNATRYRNGGGATYVMNADGAVDGTRCEALNDVPGVSTAGAMRRRADDFAPVVAPRNGIPVYEITPGLAHQLDPGYARGVGLDAATARSLGVSLNSLLPGRYADAPVTEVFHYPDDGRDQTLAYAMTEANPPRGMYDQCWVAMWPPAPVEASDLLQSTVTGSPRSSSTAKAQVVQLNARMGVEFDDPARFAARSGRYAGLAALVLAAALTVGVSRLRRLELAFARHLGMGRAEVAGLLALETAMVVTGAAALGVVLVVGYAHLTGAAEVAPFGTRVVLLALAGCLLGAVGGGLATSRQRVFRFFKAR